MATPTTFPLLPLLPAELRLRIYTLCLSHLRIIHLCTPDHPSNISYLPSPHPSLSAPPLNLSYSDISWTTRTPQPALLSVSHEARAVALSHYSLRFALLPAGPEVIYINPKLDLVYPHLEKWPEMLRLLLKDLKAFDVVDGGRGVRRLVVSTGVWGTFFDPGVNVVGRKRAAMLEGLEEVIVVMGRGVWDEAEREGGVLVVPERDSDVERWERGVLEGWKAVKDAGLEGVKVRLLDWRREGGGLRANLEDRVQTDST